LQKVLNTRSGMIEFVRNRSQVQRPRQQQICAPSEVSRAVSRMQYTEPPPTHTPVLMVCKASHQYFVTAMPCITGTPSSSACQYFLKHMSTSPP
jgi:hypothetical protein